jgi:Pretoxin HINT domain
MRHNLFNRFILLQLLLWVGLLQPDGFAELTLVKTHGGFKPIEQFVVGNHVVVVADGGQLQSYSISHAMSYVADHFIKIQINDICVCAAPDQKFYSCTRNDWVSAQALQVSEQLLCGSGNVVCVDAIETVHKQQKMHAFTIDTSHIFCVTPYEIIAHNIEPISTTLSIVALPVFAACPPAGIALAVGQAVTFGVLACVMFCKHRKAHHYEPRHTGCFSPENRNDVTTPIATGCYQPIQEIPFVCDIKAGKQDFPTTLVHEIPEQVIDKGCAFPIHAEKPVLHNAATKQTDCDQQKRYEGPWYNRTEDWVKEFKQKDKLERSEYINDGKRVFKTTDDIADCNGLKKGDYVVVDALHNDHLEVFGKNKKWKHVANFDGTLNEKKTEQGKKEPRHPLQKKG